MIRIVIKNPSPLGPNLEKWGDYHFGLALAAALEARGAQVVQHFWPEWDRDDSEDVVIVLRGKRNYRPSANKLTLMWIISHPATVLPDEMRQYNRVLVASETHYDMVRNDPSIDVDIARQCTDITTFCRQGDVAARRGVSFVANSRGVRRDILAWSQEAGTRVSIIGRHWKSLGLQGLVVRDYVSNADLPTFYGSTRLTLNDHWGDMSHYGYINNRIFDCLACGTPVLTDYFPELKAVCGDGLLYAHDAASFWEAYSRFLMRYPEVIDKVDQLWNRISRNYSFDARAEQILDWIGHCASKPERARKGRPSTEGPHSVFAETIRSFVSELRARGVTREVQCLHIFPKTEHMAQLFRSPELSYLSAGLGRGPWHLGLDPEMSCLADHHYDLIIFDDLKALKVHSALVHAKILDSASRKRAKNGMVVLPSEASAFPALTGRQSVPLNGYYVL